MKGVYAGCLMMRFMAVAEKRKLFFLFSGTIGNDWRKKDTARMLLQQVYVHAEQAIC